ncbi:MAG: Lrp/AsnC ligand binding domain-containing protein [Candidatus Thorarchaeota archaeon]|nr:Lrp/AsnC ligand binding domain-containing protein [Candidatus Thorarchaeota archaeon]
MPIKIFLAINTKKGHAEDIQSKLSKYNEVTLVCTVKNGIFDVVAIVDVESLENYRHFSIDKVGKMPNIEDYTSFIILGE